MSKIIRAEIDELYERAMSSYTEESQAQILKYADQVMADPHKYVVVAIHNMHVMAQDLVRLNGIVRQLTFVAAVNLLGEMDAELDTRSAGDRQD